MLVRFWVKNYLSFNSQQEFTMVPGRGTLLKSHKTTPVKGVSVLKTAALFGANSGGKSNFVRAIAAGKILLLHDLHTLNTVHAQRFKLDEDASLGYSEIGYELQIAGKNYSYKIVFNDAHIKEESLRELNKRGEDILIFERTEIRNYNIDTLLRKNRKTEAKQFLLFLAKATPEHKLFLHEVFERNIDDSVEYIEDLRNVIRWFTDDLKIIYPNTLYKQGATLRAADDDELKERYKILLQYFNTGIEGIDLLDVDLEKLGIPSKLLGDIKEDLQKEKEDDSYCALNFNKDLYLIGLEKGGLKAKKLVTIHSMLNAEHTEVYFDLRMESDGTKRLLDYIPLILDLIKGGKVFIVDEIERSLHPNLIIRIFELFLELKSEANSQLIVTTHESCLLDLKLLRKDEIWLVRKEKNESILYQLDENRPVRFDKSIRTEYLKGGYGAIPKFGSIEKIKKLFDGNKD